MKKTLLVITLAILTFTIFASSSNDVYAYIENYDSFEDPYEGTINQYASMFLNTNYDYDYLHYYIPSGKGGAYNIYSSYYSTSTLDTAGWLYEEQGMLWWHEYDLVEYDNNDGEGYNFYIEEDLNAAEDYFVKVRPYCVSYTGITKIMVEENIDEFSSPNGAVWFADPTYSNTSYRYLTQDQVELYYFAISNPSIWEDITEIVAVAGVDAIIGTALEATLVTVLGMTALPAAIAAVAIVAIVDVIIYLFVPTPQEVIQSACYGTTFTTPAGVNGITCVYGTRVTNENYNAMTRYTSSTYVGITRQRGTFYEQSE